ncbi:unnamed protein product [Medioppia subpectinata]|uniref:V-type proton ATPase subunit H n=1 Tax=Medioppia subpectinata TaxID=1979941 RepID=A0A7R9Q182_9ACAR|nr:unnamed protein product [Medioppia subpectinata]CAG2108276.1 unnamed protein product [Medioppia subpectinata]
MSGRQVMANLSAKLDSVLSIDEIEKTGVLAATSQLHQRAQEIRQQRVNWQSYLQSQMVSQEDFQLITQYESATGGEQRHQLLDKYGEQCAHMFNSLLNNISKDQTIQYILCIIDDMILEDRTRVELFKEYSKKKKQSVWYTFLNLLNRNDPFIQNMTALIIAKIACWTTSEPIEGSDLNLFLTWLRDQLKLSNNEYIQSIARCMQMMLQNDRYRDVFVGIDGITAIVQVLSGRINFQIQYQLAFCLWILTFNEPLATRMNKYNAIPVLADVLSEAVKEKVTRMALATFRNLIEKPTDTEITRDNAITMVQCKVLKQLEILQQSGQKFDDPDIKEDIDYLTEKLLASVQDLSSFDEYATEVKSGRLEWSPVHSSDKFWRENAGRLNEKNYELLKILVRLLETSKDPLVLSVAAHDLGEYVRHYARGKVYVVFLGQGSFYVLINV